MRTTPRVVSGSYAKTAIYVTMPEKTDHFMQISDIEILVPTTL